MNKNEWKSLVMTWQSQEIKNDWAYCTWISEQVCQFRNKLRINKKMQRECEKINHRWFHYDKFANRLGKMLDLGLQRTFTRVLTPTCQESPPSDTCQSSFSWVKLWHAYSLIFPWTIETWHVAKLSSHSLLIFRSNQKTSLLCISITSYHNDVGKSDMTQPVSVQYQNKFVWTKKTIFPDKGPVYNAN